MTDQRADRAPCAWGYVRLSREDIRGPGATEEKLQARARLCVGLAEQHGLELPSERILLERESGTTLGRAAMQQLLRMAAAGEITHVITPYQDRLSRGSKVDAQAIEDAFSAGGVTLVTSDGVTPFDEDFDETHGFVWDIRSAMARAYVRDLVKKRKKTDADRLRQNIRSRGYAPYGYRYLRAVRDEHGRQVKPQSYEVVEHEYPIVEEIFRRIRSESLHSIVNNLNGRGIPSPGVGRTSRGGGQWTRSTLKGLVTNPFYCGFYAQRQKVFRKNVRQQGTGVERLVNRAHRLAYEQYILAEEEGSWPHPITRADWDEICSLLSARSVISSDQSLPRSALLTGLLYCPNGRPMRRNSGGRPSAKTGKTCGGAMYGCDCRDSGQGHQGNHASAERLDEWVCGNVRALLSLDAVRSQLLALEKHRKPAQNQSVRTRLNRAISDRAKANAQLEWLRDNAAHSEAMFGAKAYSQSVAKAKAEVARLDTLLQDLRRASSESGSPALSQLAQLMHEPVEVWWEYLGEVGTRSVVGMVVQRIDLKPIPEGRRYYTDAEIEWAFTAPTVTGNLIPFPAKRGRPRS